MARTDQPLDLILVGNGPGEISGWIAPVARAARRMDGSPALRLTLALSPSQFAAGREAEVAGASGLFDRIVAPRDCLRLALGRGHLDHSTRGVVIHLGGDLWTSAGLARRLQLPACALVETPLIARRHRFFRQIFAASQRVAAALLAGGVPAEKIVTTGDPRVDAIGAAASEAGRDQGDVIAMLPGSRDRIFRVMAPFFLDVAAALAAQRPGIRCQMIVSEFLTPGLVRETVERSSGPAAPGVEWVRGPAWAAVARSRLAVTIPGTNTVELALAGLPFAVVVPEDQAGAAAVEGALEWISRLPGVGTPLKRMVLRAYLRRMRFIALPNQWAGREIAPEWVGHLSPAQVAAKVAALLDDEAARARIAEGLRALRSDGPGASDRIARQAVALAGGPAS